MKAPLRQKHDSTWRLETVPSSSAPSVDSVTTLVNQRRYRKRITTVMLCTTTLCTTMFFATTLLISRGSWMGKTSEQVPATADDLNRIADLSRPVQPHPVQPHPVQPHPVQPRPTHADPQVHSESDLAPPKFKVYARVRQPEPVFQFDEKQQVLIPVGWIHTRRSFPVNLDSFSNRQVESLQTVLRNDTLQTSYEL